MVGRMINRNEQHIKIDPFFKSIIVFVSLIIIHVF